MLRGRQKGKWLYYLRAQVLRKTLKISRPLSLVSREVPRFHSGSLLHTSPDPSKDYTLFTDASKFGYAGVLTQEYEDNGIRKYHSICYVSGLFRGSQLNWATLTKEAYTIYMSVRKSDALHHRTQH